MSNRWRLRIGIALQLCCLLSLTACRDRETAENTVRTLPPCTAEHSVFQNMPLTTWPAHYHRTVAQTIDAHVNRSDGVASVPLLCTAEEIALVEPATETLRETARMLPAWRAQADDLHETDLVPVLLEFVRVYECALHEYRSTRWALHNETGALQLGFFNRRILSENALIERELAIARPALERTLLLTSGIDRLRPLSYGTECLKRTSLDLRNVLSLAAEASACLPRTWDAHGSLRDLSE